MEDNKHKAIFKGETVRKLYYVIGFYDKTYFKTSKYEHIEWKDIHKCYLDRPLLDTDEEVYINELDKTVKVSKRVRTTNGEILYYIENYEVIEDEKTIESEKIAESEIKEKENLKEVPTKKWWQFWK